MPLVQLVLFSVSVDLSLPLCVYVCFNKPKSGSEHVLYKWLRVFWQVFVYLFVPLSQQNLVSNIRQLCNRWRGRHESWQVCSWDQNAGLVRRYVYYRTPVTSPRRVCSHCSWHLVTVGSTARREARRYFVYSMGGAFNSHKFSIASSGQSTDRIRKGYGPPLCTKFRKNRSRNSSAMANLYQNVQILTIFGAVVHICKLTMDNLFSKRERTQGSINLAKICIKKSSSQIYRQTTYSLFWATIIPHLCTALKYRLE